MDQNFWNIRIPFIFTFFLVGCTHNPAIANVQTSTTMKCEILNKDREVLLNLDYKSFDQTLPDGGWRKYQACKVITRDLIDEYTQKHFANLGKSQKDVLLWHSGQLSGFLGDYSRAITSMKQTLKDSEKPSDAFLWNPYARATIAFLRRDKATLLKERALLARGSSPYSHMNLRKVDAFIRCFNSTYQDAYSETCVPKETNTERIRSLAIRLDFKKPLLAKPMGLQDILRQKKIILVGEIHGTREVPELFGNLVASVANEKTKTLAVLEINQASQITIDEFLKTGDKRVLRKDFFFNRKYQDGRSSKAMVNLLEKLSKLPNTMVLCMDPMTGNQTMTSQERDTQMASFINSNYKNFDNTLVLTGNIHSSLIVGTPWDMTYQPLGYELKNMMTDSGGDQIFNILVRHEKVDSWNCQGNEPSSCKVRYGKNFSTDYSEAVDWRSYFVAEVTFSQKTKPV